MEGARNGRLWGAVEAMLGGQTQGVKQRSAGDDGGRKGQKFALGVW